MMMGVREPAELEEDGIEVIGEEVTGGGEAIREYPRIRSTTSEKQNQ